MMSKQLICFDFTEYPKIYLTKKGRIKNGKL